MNNLVNIILMINITIAIYSWLKFNEITHMIENNVDKVYNKDYNKNYNKDYNVHIKKYNLEENYHYNDENDIVMDNCKTTTITTEITKEPLN